jgi:hypothetical protein
MEWRERWEEGVELKEYVDMRVWRGYEKGSWGCCVYLMVRLGEFLFIS